ncbi:MAG: hypothetical protein ABFC78_08255 [Methanoregula sp.]
MQLPRGTFREIQKNQKAGTVLEELERELFSGICSISCRDTVSTLVLRSGKCILAEYDTFKGDTALEHLLTALTDENIDTALSTLTETQIQLSLEFNTTSRITKIGQTRSISRKPRHAAGQVTQRPVVRKSGPTPAGTNAPSHPAPKNPVKVIPKSSKTAPAPFPKEDEIPPGGTPDDDKEIDLETLDSLNIEQMTDKIRDECKIMVKNLHMDHLMDQKD